MSVDLPAHPLDEEIDQGGIAWNPASPYVKEMRKWEQFPSEWTVKSKPGNPFVFREFPKMLYKAQRLPNGQYACQLPAPNPYEFDRADVYQQACLMVESFNRSCQTIARDESDERLKKGQGWATSAEAAMALHEAHEQAIGNAAAEAAYAARSMSERARAEFEAAGESTHQHVTDVTGVPKSRRGRRRKSEAVVAVPEQE